LIEVKIGGELRQGRERERKRERDRQTKPVGESMRDNRAEEEERDWGAAERQSLGDNRGQGQRVYGDNRRELGKERVEKRWGLLEIYI
jgi:hypothetical protein